MSQVEYYTGQQPTWWERLFGGILGKSAEQETYELPTDSLFANNWQGGYASVADVPDRIKAQIREDAVLDAFNQLEASLRLLLHATTPDRQPPTVERCQQILQVWRYELEHRIRLTPDTYSGAVQRYEPEMDECYAIDGRCQRGDLLRIRVPAWRMNERVVVRGEAEMIDSKPIGAAATRLETAEAADALPVADVAVAPPAPVPVITTEISSAEADFAFLLEAAAAEAAGSGGGSSADPGQDQNSATPSVAAVPEGVSAVFGLHGHPE